MLDALKKRLGVSGEDEDNLLEACIEDAADELQLYLGWPDDEWAERPDLLDRKIVQLATLLYRQNQVESALPGVASVSTTEERLSQSVSYKGSADWQTQKDQLISSMARYRRVGVRGGSDDSEA